MLWVCLFMFLRDKDFKSHNYKGPQSGKTRIKSHFLTMSLERASGPSLEENIKQFLV